MAAATTTWFLNRNLTFAGYRTHSLGKEWLKFVLLNACGGLINYSVYAAYVKIHGSASHDLLAGVALGSLAGMVANFFVSRRFVFNARR